ncbi:MAG: acyl-CoA dehydrogenase family protein [Candidatus Microthrix sp.]|nr:acyl-CoA dehydrogenase family protein [Candidatus Microthrix sp.]
MDFDLPTELSDYLGELDRFIEAEIAPLEADNIEYFDHRREHARTDWDNGGLPRPEWEALLGEMMRRADAAGHLRYALPESVGGRGGSNLDMAVIREHLAAKGLGLHNDLQNETSVVGNFPFILMMLAKGTDAQRAEFIDGAFAGTHLVAFGLTEPEHGSDATFLDTTAVRDGDDWVINGTKRFNTGMHRATHDMVFARTGGEAGDAEGITCFIVPTATEGVEIGTYWWTFNMPTDHPDVHFTDVRVGDDAVFGEVGRGLELANIFVHENRIRQAASSLGAAQYCIDEAAKYATVRAPFGRPLWRNQAIQFPLAELQTEAAMLRALIRQTAWRMDRHGAMDVTDAVSMCNYRANRLVCDAADQAMQTCGGMGYTRHMPFEHIYRHHRRYRITEGSEEIQIRRVAGVMFGKQAKR